MVEKIVTNLSTWPTFFVFCSAWRSAECWAIIWLWSNAWSWFRTSQSWGEYENWFYACQRAQGSQPFIDWIDTKSFSSAKAPGLAMPIFTSDQLSIDRQRSAFIIQICVRSDDFTNLFSVHLVLLRLNLHVFVQVRNRHSSWCNHSIVEGHQQTAVLARPHVRAAPLAFHQMTETCKHEKCNIFAD